MEMCNFSDLPLKGTFFRDCILHDAIFTQSQLSESDFEGSDLKGSIFHHTNLEKASFLNAINYSIHPLNNKLSKAKFSKPEVLSLLDHLDISIS